ncbi:MAG: haloalkane dehalogenase [Deltaproteobacteria bacterium HGW-Deltaproteobacteria-6]|jgi:haloalkane dehalogenase|nr:MAG: haloalkane dehalogenase [Deltaproteobacteria bacterium HGW-Deltaproteobacteria-6]
MKVLRTPDERFRNLPAYPFAPHYVEVPDGEGGVLRIHYVDEGPQDADVVLLLHGEPTWSFLYRKMIPVFVKAGHRVIAPDLAGFGKSDKPASRHDYSFQRHVDWMLSLLDTLKLNRMTLVCQDWGGLIGLRLVAARPDLFDRVVAANTGLPTGDAAISDAFLAWQKFSRESPQFDVGNIVKSSNVVFGKDNNLPILSDEVAAAYDAPFPDDSYKEGARIFPSLVPTTPDDPAAAANRKAWEVLSAFKKPFLTAFSDGDPITRGGDLLLQKLIPGAKGQPHTTIRGAGHFLQEDKGEEFANVIAAFMSDK